MSVDADLAAMMDSVFADLRDNTPSGAELWSRLDDLGLVRLTGPESAGGSGADSLVGNEGNDTLDFGSGDSVLGWDGNDLFRATGNLSLPAVINGGNGTDYRTWAQDATDANGNPVSSAQIFAYVYPNYYGVGSPLVVALVAGSGTGRQASAQLIAAIALFINGLPIATFELKNSLTKQTVEDAVEQAVEPAVGRRFEGVAVAGERADDRVAVVGMAELSVVADHHDGAALDSSAG